MQVVLGLTAFSRVLRRGSVAGVLGALLMLRTIVPGTASCAPDQPVPVLDDLSALRWSHRLLLVAAGESNAELVATLRGQSARIDDRDMLWFVLGGSAMQSNYQGVLAAGLATALRKNYRLTPGTVVLIGKDGDVKLRSAALDLEDVFARVDAMPMRQSEMRRTRREDPQPSAAGEKSIDRNQGRPYSANT